MRHTTLADRRETLLWRDVVIQPPKPSLLSRVWTVVCYTSVATAVGVAVFLVTPAHAGGSMAQEVRVVHVSPSVVLYGSKLYRKLKVDNNKAQNSINLEQLKFEHSRQLLADKAYYEKLKDQRKHK